MRWAILLASAIGAYGQQFEVASVKLSGPPDRSIPNEPRDPGRFTKRNVPLAALISQAYGLRPYSLVTPSWTFIAYFDLDARLADGANREQLPAMLQNLLAERFGLKAHWEDREMTVYDLAIAKGGPKIHEAKEGEPPPAAPPDMSRAEDGYLPPEGGTRWNHGLGGAMREQIDMETLARKLDGMVGKPVHDETGMKGKYNLMMHWGRATDPADPAGDPERVSDGLFSALQGQLGLKLEAKKAPVPVLVVDRVEKVPTAN